MSLYFRTYIKEELWPVKEPIRFKTSFKNCVLLALKARGWREVFDGDEFDLNWCEKQTISEVMEQHHLSPTQRVNHFTLYYQLCRKDYLIKNLKKTKRQLEKEGKAEEAALYNFFPQTFHLPSEYSLFAEEFKRGQITDPRKLWIMKPVSKCQGKGIFIMNKLSQIANWKTKSEGLQSYIVQSYIIDPLLFCRKKFDMRIYVLCTNYSQLTLYLYRSGFARFTHQPYDQKDTSNLYSHLTNVAIQKNSQAYDEALGGKWFIDRMKIYLLSRFGEKAVGQCFSQIQTLIIKTHEAVQKQIINDKHSFELYGYDILLDRNLKPWLLQVNGGPSMTSNIPEDCALKCGLIDDVLTIVDMERFLTGAEEQVGGFDLIYKGKPVKLNQNYVYASQLGCLNNRAKNLKKLAKQALLRLIKQKQKQLQKQKEKEEQQNRKRAKKEKEQKEKELKAEKEKVVRRQPVLARRVPNEMVRERGKGPREEPEQ